VYKFSQNLWLRLFLNKGATFLEAGLGYYIKIVLIYLLRVVFYVSFYSGNCTCVCMSCLMLAPHCMHVAVVESNTVA
jgi:hypothetical protein